jgi:thioesterase domain-containing protein
MLGQEQPFYVINANGIDGRQPVIEDVQEMVAAYLDDIRRTRPAGSVRVGGMCAGCFVAIEIARVLQNEGRQTGPVILVDPPVLPIGYEKRQNAIAVTPELKARFLHEVRERFREKLLDPNNSDGLAIDPSDPAQMNSAVMAAMSTMVAFAKYVPRAFAGPAYVVISENRAAGFFHPEMPWHKLLSGPRVVHVLPWSHTKLYGPGLSTVAHMVKFVLEEDPLSEAFPEAADAVGKGSNRNPAVVLAEVRT